MRIAFVIGHTKLSKGAYSSYFELMEYDFWKQFECDLKKVGDVFFHNYLIHGYTSKQKSIAKKTKDYDVVFELHFNSANTRANGCEALYFYTNNQTKRISQDFCDKYTSLTGARNRGAKELYNKEQRGFGFVKEQKASAIILEPFFGDNLLDSARFDIDKFLKAVKYAVNK